jgi:hypothetical protein
MFQKQPTAAACVLPAWIVHSIAMDDFNYKKANHRRFKRRSASLKIRVTCHKKAARDGGPKITAVALDLSEAGARLLVTVPLAVGEEVVLGLERILDQRKLTRVGTVVWSFQIRQDGYAVGLRLAEPLGGGELLLVTL